MGAPALKQGPQQLELIDDPFMNIMSTFAELIIADAGAAANQILEISSQFLSSSTKGALKNFHDLYFGSAKMTASKEDVNREVDDIFDQVSAQVAQGKEVADAEIIIKENAEAKQSRLLLSGLQKQLETIISLDAGIRKKLVPILQTLQFEDMIKQRLTHICTAWAATKTATDQGCEDFRKLAEDIGAGLSSAEERKLYYEIVLDTAPPDSGFEEVLMFDQI